MPRKKQTNKHRSSNNKKKTLIQEGWGQQATYHANPSIENYGHTGCLAVYDPSIYLKPRAAILAFRDTSWLVFRSSPLLD